MDFSLIPKEKMLMSSKQGLCNLPLFYDTLLSLVEISKDIRSLLADRTTNPRPTMAPLDSTVYRTIDTTNPQAGTKLTTRRNLWRPE